MIIYKKGNNDNYQIVIKSIDLDYLIKLEFELNKTNLINEIEQNIKLFNDKLSKYQEININKLNKSICQFDGIYSSKIESMELTDKHDNETNNKIKAYIDNAFMLSLLIKPNYKIKLDDIALFHDAIEPSKIMNWRYINNVNQFIEDFQAPILDDLELGVKQWYSTYLGNKEYSNIHYLLRWAFQHLYFETLHPFDDGNGRTGRMLNLLFFKNQNIDAFNDILIETSSVIFDDINLYQDLLSQSRIIVKPRPELHESIINKSVQKDCSFCTYMLLRLNEKIIWMINNLDSLLK